METKWLEIIYLSPYHYFHWDREHFVANKADQKV